MEKYPTPSSATRIQIADDAVNRVPSLGNSVYAQPQRLEKPGLRRFDTQEKDFEEDEDERDIKKKQVCQSLSQIQCLSLTRRSRLSRANISSGTPPSPSPPLPPLSLFPHSHTHPNPTVLPLQLTPSPLPLGSHTSPLASSTVTLAPPPSMSTLQPSPRNPATMTFSARSP